MTHLFSKKLLFSLWAFLCLPALAMDRDGIRNLLSSTGLPVEIHGLMPQDRISVVTWRNPDDFFDFVHMSAVISTPELVQEFRDLHRQDKILIWGKILDNPSPQIHVELSKIQVVKKYDFGEGDYHYSADFPDQLLALQSAEFLVHNVSGEGRVLVLEYHDHIVPMFVKADQTSLTKDLYRNDLIRAAFKVQKSPGQPTHLRLDTSAAKPLEVLEAVLPKHGKPADVEGELVLFPKSPQVRFNVYAVLERLPYGLQRQYTLVNFDSSEEFTKIRDRLDQAWATAPRDAVNGRNKFIHKTLRVRAKGVFNVVDPGQANVQILLRSADDLEIIKP